MSSDAGIVCPYCDEESGVLRDLVHSEERDGKLTMIRRCVCKSCGESFYAVAVVSDIGYSYIRRDQLEPMTGIRLRKGVFRQRRGLSWSG